MAAAGLTAEMPVLLLPSIDELLIVADMGVLIVAEQVGGVLHVPRADYGTSGVGRGADAAHAKLDGVAAAVKREAEGAEADPLDEAMVAAVAGLADTMTAEAGALAALEARLGKLARRQRATE